MVEHHDKSNRKELSVMSEKIREHTYYYPNMYMKVCEYCGLTFYQNEDSDINANPIRECK